METRLVRSAGSTQERLKEIEKEDKKIMETETIKITGRNIQDIQDVVENAVHNNPESEDKFEPAPDVERIARQLIVQHHGHLVDAKIKYLFRRGPWSSQKRETLGKATKVTGVNEYLTGLDFIIMINIEVWEQLNQKERVALIDHELEHCCREDDKYFVQGHDVEDFLAVIRRNGFWTPDLRRVQDEAVQGKLELVEEEKEEENLEAVR